MGVGIPRDMLYPLPRNPFRSSFNSWVKKVSFVIVSKKKQLLQFSRHGNETNIMRKLKHRKLILKASLDPLDEFD